MQPSGQDTNMSLVDLDGAMQPNVNEPEAMNTSVFEGNVNNLSVIHPGGGIAGELGQEEATSLGNVNTSILDNNFDPALEAPMAEIDPSALNPNVEVLQDSFTNEFTSQPNNNEEIAVEPMAGVDQFQKFDPNDI